MRIKIEITGITKKYQLQAKETRVTEEIEKRNMNGMEIQKSMEKSIEDVYVDDTFYFFSVLWR